MRRIGNLFSIALVTGVTMLGCKKAKGPVAVDPNSAEGIMQCMHEQGRLFDEAFNRKDFSYIHDYTYYFNGLTQALLSKLDEGQKQHVRTSLKELMDVANDLDTCAGHHHAEATADSLKRLQIALKELDKQFHEGQKSG